MIRAFPGATDIGQIDGIFLLFLGFFQHDAVFQFHQFGVTGIQAQAVSAWIRASSRLYCFSK